MSIFDYGNAVIFDKKIFGFSLLMCDTAKIQISDENILLTIGWIFRKNWILSKSDIVNIIIHKEFLIRKGIKIIHRNPTVPKYLVFIPRSLTKTCNQLSAMKYTYYEPLNVNL